MRISERLLLGFFVYATVAAFVFPLSHRERLILVALNFVTTVIALLLSRFGTVERSRFLATVRDWIPCVLILVAYRESGLFVTPDPRHHLDLIFIRMDDALLRNAVAANLLAATSPWLQRYLEFSYFLCYPSVPLGIGVLYLARRAARRFSQESATLTADAARNQFEAAIEHFWTTVLLAVLTCYVLFPFFPLTPPRELFHDVPGPQVAPVLRGMNHWILGRYAVGVSLFPSGHVAAATAMALAIRAHLPRAGVAFMVLAVSIAAATVYGRYHYAADALAGALVGIASFPISNRFHKLQNKIG